LKFRDIVLSFGISSKYKIVVTGLHRLALGYKSIKALKLIRIFRLNKVHTMLKFLHNLMIHATVFSI
jgi:hypothetical protein